MLSELHTAHKVIGVKQSKKAIRDGAAAQVFVALDAEKRVVGPIYELCSEHGYRGHHNDGARRCGRH